MKVIYKNNQGDLLLELTRKEFFEIFNPKDRNIIVKEGSTVTFFHNLGEEIICDVCNADVDDPVYIVALQEQDKLDITDVVCQHCKDEALQIIKDANK
jgi:hypothetical protein